MNKIADDMTAAPALGICDVERSGEPLKQMLPALLPEEPGLDAGLGIRLVTEDEA